MNINLEGKRALVGGSTAGIGRAAAHALATLGAEVILLARNPEKLEATRDELPVTHGQKHTIVAADFSRGQHVHDALDRFRANNAAPIEILINNTGGPPAGPAIDAELQAYQQAFEQHLLCNQILVQALLPGMKDRGYGRIINVISTSVLMPITNLGVSNTIRGAVANWARTLAGELGPFNITVNNILPGFTRTDRLRSLLEARAQKQSTTREEVEAKIEASIPLRRMGEPEELGQTIAFLASPAASYITGVNLPVDGGRTAVQ